MEKFIQNAGRALAKVRITTNDFLNERIGGNRRNLIFFLVSAYILLILIVSAVLNFRSLIDHYHIYLGLFLTLILAILWVAIFYESENHMDLDRHSFLMEPIRKNRIKYQLLDLEKDSEKQLERLVNGKNVQHKINFTLENKSKDSANHRVLFTLFDELVLGGIKDLTGEHKQEFFQLLMDSFLMNGEPVKPTTLSSSFSAWKADQEKLNSREQRHLVKKILGKE